MRKRKEDLPPRPMEMEVIPINTRARLVVRTDANDDNIVVCRQEKSSGGVWVTVDDVTIEGAVFGEFTRICQKACSWIP